MKRNGKRLGTYGSARYGVFLNNELRTSPAYKALTPAARLILIEWLAKYMRESKGDSESLRTTGVTFAFSDCSESLNESTFKDGRQALIERGFIECLPKMQSMTPGSRRIYVPSVKWKTYSPTAQEARRLASAAKARNEALIKWNRFKEKKRGRHE